MLRVWESKPAALVAASVEPAPTACLLGHQALCACGDKCIVQRRYKWTWKARLMEVVCGKQVRQVQCAGFLVHRPDSVSDFRAPSERSI